MSVKNPKNFAEAMTALQNKNMQVGVLDKQIAEFENNSYLKLSEEAKETLKGMVEFCVNRAYCMGMDEGYQGDTKRPFRIELEDFIKGGVE
jgi:hypothetical protein